MPQPASYSYRERPRSHLALVPVEESGEHRVPGGAADTGRHALHDDALLTPIFHALAHSGPADGRAVRRLQLVDPVERFRRDPLTAPLPVTGRARTRRPAAHARPEPAADRPPADPVRHAMAQGGRHHLRHGRVSGAH